VWLVQKKSIVGKKKKKFGSVSNLHYLCIEDGSKG
jgi:hypothetical protein